MIRNILVVLCLCFSSISTQGADYFELRDGLKNSRLVFEQTRKGRVAFLGGSITKMKGWKELVSADLQKRFPKTEFDFIDAGIPSTGSTPGAFRLTHDVFKNGPVDLLFEEASVNDLTNGRTDVEQVRAMEGIVRHARKLNPKIDIIMMHFVDPEKVALYNKGITPKVIQNHEKVAEHYQIPSLNLTLEVAERMNRGEFTWKDDFKNLHPSPFGHRLYSNTISRCFDAAWKEKSARSKPTDYQLPAKLDEYCYDSGKLKPPQNATALNGFEVVQKWKNSVGGRTRPGFDVGPFLIGKQPGDSFELKFQGSAIGLFLTAGPDAGIIEYRIDNGDWIEKDLFTQWSARLHIPWLYVFAAELNPSEHHKLKVRISKKKNPASKGHACRILYPVVNGN